MRQFSFDPEDYATTRDCVKARKERAKALRSMGYRVALWTRLSKQRNYGGLVPPRDMSCRNVYMLDVY
jgi:hypothetical protein